MAQVNRSCVALLIGLLVSEQAQGQTVKAPAPPADTVSEVVITAPKKKTGIEALLPGTDKPKSMTCEVLVANDPSLLAQMQIGLALQDSVLGPTVNLPTRKPRNPDYSAPPVTAPGSALPVLIPARRRPLQGPGEPADIFAPAGADTFDSGAGASVDTFGSPADFGNTGMSADAAIRACRALFSRGNPNTPASAKDARGRAEIARYNKNMPMGFELFDLGRYEEALDQFKTGYNKLSDAHGGDEAALMVGKIYLLGLGAKSDPKEAVVWLKRAAQAPFSPSRDMPVFDPLEPERNTPIGEAALMLGNLYLKGFPGIEKDPAEARKWFTRAAYVGHVPAAKILGDLYYSGYETPHDVRKAVQHYTKAATLNFGPAQVALADIYYVGAPGVPADLKTALAWYNHAAKQQQPGGLYALAVAYDTGEGVAPDPVKALGFYKAAALKGQADAQAALGSYFYEGGQVPKDLVAARQWFDAGARGGNTDAMFNLGVMMMKGEGGAKDPTRGWVWLKLAQNGGAQQAAAALTALEARMTPEEKRAAAQLLAPSGRS